MKTFEKPLSLSEEKMYFEKLSQGDREAKEILILRNMRLVAHIVKKYSENDKDVEDMLSIGTIGLVKAVDTYDYTKGSRFSTYAAKCIDNEILMMFRSKRKCQREVSIYEPIGVDKEGNDISFFDVIENVNGDFLKDICYEENLKWLYSALDKLTEREKKIIVYRYGLMGE